MILHGRCSPFRAFFTPVGPFCLHFLHSRVLKTHYYKDAEKKGGGRKTGPQARSLPLDGVVSENGK